MSNAERQRRFRAAQAALGRTPRTLYLKDQEIEIINRVLYHLRELDEIPAQVRDKKGRFRPFEY